MKVTRAKGEGQGSCKRCTDNGKWNRTWMCFLNKITSLFANMQYGKLCTDPERTAYYKLKLNEIFGSGAYQDTDSVRGENE